MTDDVTSAAKTVSHETGNNIDCEGFGGSLIAQMKCN